MAPNISRKIIAFYYGFRRFLLLVRFKTYYFFRKRRKAGDFNPKAIRRILVVCTGLIGDTVMCLPALAELRRLFPDTQIFGLVDSKSNSLLEGSPYIDEFIIYNSSPFPLRPGKVKNSILLKKRIRDLKIDLAVILLGDDFVPLFYQLGIPWQVGVAGNWFSFLLTHIYSIGEPQKCSFKERLSALTSLGLKHQFQRPKIFISPKAENAVSYILKSHQIGRGDRIILMHPFGNSRYKWWPMDKVSELIGLIKKNYKDIHIFLIGGSREKNYLEKNIHSLPEEVINLTGMLSVNELCALTKRADLIITTNSGPLHIGGALERPTIGLFRAITPEHMQTHKTISPITWSGPSHCYKKCRWDYCLKHPCCQMKGIEPEKVLDLVKQILELAPDIQWV